jgi:Lrp/AsnC family transcriptional regulator
MREFTMDATDIRILGVLQDDASLSVAEIAERVNLTPTPCWRRIQRLERDGVISRKVAILDKERLGLGITVFVAVRTNKHSGEWLTRFHRLVSSMPEVVDFVRLAGNIDYLIRVVVPDVQSYDAFYKRMIDKLEFYDVSSMFQMEEIKSTTALPLGYVVPVQRNA